MKRTKPTVREKRKFTPVKDRQLSRVMEPDLCAYCDKNEVGHNDPYLCDPCRDEICYRPNIDADKVQSISNL